MASDQPWAEKWTKLTPLGKGGQGSAFRAESKSEPAQIGALKLLKNNGSAQARRRMAREVVNLATVHQAGGRVPRVLDHNASPENVGIAKVPLYLVMELVEGDTLRQLVASRGPLTLAEAVSIALDLCRTIAVAHGESVLHRDLKPENVVVKSSDEFAIATILDYGLSFNDQTDGDDDLTRIDEGFGNKFLILPEHSFGQDQRDPRSDLTAVAAIVYYCLTGLIPALLRDAQGKMPHQRNEDALQAVTESNPTTTHSLRTFFTKAFTYEVDLRFQTVDGLVSRLNELAKVTVAQMIEDPITAATRAKELLHRHSRPTILARFRAGAEQLTAEVVGVANGLTRELLLQEVQIGLINLADKELPKGVDLLVASPAIQVQILNHASKKAIKFCVGSSGSECIVYEAPFHLNPATNQWVDGELYEVLRYSGSEPPPTSLIVQHFRTQIARTIEELLGLALGGQVPI